MSEAKFDYFKTADYVASGYDSYAPYEAAQQQRSPEEYVRSLTPAPAEIYRRTYKPTPAPDSTQVRSYSPEPRNTFFSSAAANRLPPDAHMSRSYNPETLEWGGRVFYGDQWVHQADARPRVGYPPVLTQLPTNRSMK